MLVELRDLRDSPTTQAYEVPQASAHTVLGVDCWATLQASSTPLLVLPMPTLGDAHLRTGHADAAHPQPSSMFSSPSAPQSHSSPTSHEGCRSKQVSRSQDQQSKQADAPAQHRAASSQRAPQPTGAAGQCGQAGGGGAPATEQPLAPSEQRRQESPAGEGERPRTGEEERKVPCVLLVPCCEAVHGRFPLNGTYFQTNEVFLDAATLQHPFMASLYKN